MAADGHHLHNKGHSEDKQFISKTLQVVLSCPAVVPTASARHIGLLGLYFKNLANFLMRFCVQGIKAGRPEQDILYHVLRIIIYFHSIILK